MEQVLQCYGKGIAAGIVLIAVMVLLFAGIRDEQGNRGIINIIKTWIPEEETITENAAIDAFAEAGEVAYPTIRYAYNGMLHRGAYLPGDLFSAVDGMGEERSVFSIAEGRIVSTSHLRFMLPPIVSTIPSIRNPMIALTMIIAAFFTYISFPGFLSSHRFTGI